MHYNNWNEGVGGLGAELNMFNTPKFDVLRFIVQYLTVSNTFLSEK